MLFHERMKTLSLHRLPLKERMKDQTINYVDLFCRGPHFARLEEDLMPRVSRRLALQKMKSEDDRATYDEHDKILDDFRNLNWARICNSMIQSRIIVLRIV